MDRGEEICCHKNVTAASQYAVPRHVSFVCGNPFVPLTPNFIFRRSWAKVLVPTRREDIDFFHGRRARNCGGSLTEICEFRRNRSTPPAVVGHAAAQTHRRCSSSCRAAER